LQRIGRVGFRPGSEEGSEVAGRIGVVVAGDVYANPSLVRPFLEDDGYRVEAEVSDGAELLPAVSGAMPDAVVVDEDLLATRPHALEDIRLVSPVTKVVVIGAAPPGGNSSHSADAYLDPGASLATMSVTIGRLVGNGQLGPSGDVPGGDDRSAGGLIRFVASVGLPLVAVWTLIVAVTPPGVAPPAADTTDLAQDVIFTPQGTDRLDEAYVALDRLIGAVRSGNPVMATIWARTLMESREGAIATGYVVIDLDHAITARVAAVLGLLSPGAIAELRDILGALFPELPDEPPPAGGSDLILDPAIGSGGGGLTGGSGSPGTDPGVISGPIVDGPIIGGPIVGGGDGIAGFEPGDGRAWGQSHKGEHEATKASKKAAKEEAKDARHGPSSNDGSDHGPPPWSNANGHAGSPGNGHGQAKGHAKDHPGDGPADASSGGPGGQGHGNGEGHGNGHAKGHDKKG
jgi:hypothetical protein